MARTLGDPDTNLARFLDRLGRTAEAVAPEAASYANGFSAGADALEAWSRNEGRLRESLRESPRTLGVGIPALRVQRPFLEHTRETSEALRDAAAVMPANLPRIESALDRGVDVQPQAAAALLASCEPTLDSLEELMTDRRTTGALRGLTDTVEILRPAHPLRGSAHHRVQPVHHRLRLCRRGRDGAGGRAGAAVARELRRH